MAHIIKEDRAEKLSDYMIYAIVSPFNDKKIYISKTRTHRLRKHYGEHVGLRVKKTETMFREAKKSNILPPIYALETDRISDKEAFRRCVAWTKYFQTHGFDQVTKDVLTEYASDLIEKTKTLYDEIKDLPLEQVLQPEGGLLPDYGSQKKKTEGDCLQVSLRLEQDEYEEIKKRAIEQGLSLNAYCKKMVLSGKINNIDLSFIREYTNKLSSIESLLVQLLYTFCVRGKYYPSDISNIQDCYDQIVKMHEELNNLVIKLIYKMDE